MSVGQNAPTADASAGGAAAAVAPRPRTTPGGLWSTVRADLRQKALWLYESAGWRATVKVLLTDGTFSMLLYRLMQWSGRHRLVPLEMIFNKLNSALCHCVIGRGAHFGPGLVLIHSTGVVINGSVYGGAGVHIEHQVTIGAERRASPVIGDGVFIGAGAKIIGAVTVGDGARVGANAVVVHNVPPHCTVVGIPAKVVRRRDPAAVAGHRGAAGADVPSGGGVG